MKQLKKLKREQLIAIMLEQQEKIEKQEETIMQLTERLEDKKILLEKSGSIAEASLALNKVFEAAQAAADQYLQNIKRDI
ncbi:DNA repair protein [Streptococcus hillyeri]|uniref:DNA repair protein n=1 Tax=Streptococcus hillyeri TaxID=2282420 RepID=A0A3L9DPS9_9STRE|nr:DNA repair protein [Streptococcus hillyeri]RLY01953.1 DNA repair protein [Streptococcus hillyeri]